MPFVKNRPNVLKPMETERKTVLKNKFSDIRRQFDNFA